MYQTPRRIAEIIQQMNKQKYNRPSGLRSVKARTFNLEQKMAQMRPMLIELKRMQELEKMEDDALMRSRGINCGENENIQRQFSKQAWDRVNHV
jgi:hypothetical protein